MELTTTTTATEWAGRLLEEARALSQLTAKASGARREPLLGRDLLSRLVDALKTLSNLDADDADEEETLALVGKLDATLRKLRAVLTVYVAQSNALLRLAQTGQLARQVKRCYRRLHAVLSSRGFPGRHSRATWKQIRYDERETRIGFFQDLLVDKQAVRGEVAGEGQALHVLTLLKFAYARYVHKLRGSEGEVVCGAFELVTEISGLVVVTLPEWFLPLEGLAERALLDDESVQDAMDLANGSQCKCHDEEDEHSGDVKEQVLEPEAQGDEQDVDSASEDEVHSNSGSDDGGEEEEVKLVETAYDDECNEGVGPEDGGAVDENEASEADKESGGEGTGGEDNGELDEILSAESNDNVNSVHTEGEVSNDGDSIEGEELHDGNDQIVGTVREDEGPSSSGNGDVSSSEEDTESDVMETAEDEQCDEDAALANETSEGNKEDDVGEENVHEEEAAGEESEDEEEAVGEDSTGEDCEEGEGTLSGEPNEEDDGSICSSADDVVFVHDEGEVAIDVEDMEDEELGNGDDQDVRCSSDSDAHSSSDDEDMLSDNEGKESVIPETTEEKEYDEEVGTEDEKVIDADEMPEGDKDDEDAVNGESGGENCDEHGVTLPAELNEADEEAGCDSAGDVASVDDEAEVHDEAGLREEADDPSGESTLDEEITHVLLGLEDGDQSEEDDSDDEETSELSPQNAEAADVGLNTLTEWEGVPMLVEHLGGGAGDKSEEACLRQAAMWFQCLHPHVVKLFGACHVGEPLFLHERTSSLRSLQDYPAHIWAKLLQVARALQFLHWRGLVHQNLTCDNIRIGSDGCTAKLHGAWMTPYQTTTSARAREDSELSSAWRWKSPEEIGGDKPTYASDIFSLGMCFIEAATGDQPWGDTVGDLEGPDLVSEGKLPPRPASMSDDTWDLIENMCAFDPTERCDVSYVVRQLRQLVRKESSDKLVGSKLERSESSATFRSADLDEESSGTDVSLEDGPIEEMLKKTASLCCDTPGIDSAMKVHVQTRLEDIYHEIKLLSDSDVDEDASKRLVRVLLRFNVFLGMDRRYHPVFWLTGSRMETERIRLFHYEIDSLVNAFNLQVEDSIHDWRGQWDEDCQFQQDKFRAMLVDASSWLEELSDEEQLEATTLLRFEASKHAGSYNEGELELIESTRKTMERLGHSIVQQSLLLPRWFIPGYEVVFDKEQPFSRGSFGSVHLAKWMDTPRVVVKKVFLDQDKSGELFLGEVSIWYNIHHPNVVELYGACHVGQRFFVCEYASNGPLDEYLRDVCNGNANCPYGWRKLRDAALGLRYLHHRRIVHGDLKCNNILVSSDGTVKITDFGLSYVMKRKKGSAGGDHGVLGALRWKAPECLMGNSPSFASDVYSLGMCIIEAITGEFPWGNSLPDAAVSFHVRRRKRLPARPLCFSTSQWDLVQRMCCFEPKDRIEVSVVVDWLQAFI